jgi:sulfatase modifying factor 1
MKTTTAFAFFSLAICYASVVQATVTFDWATIGNPNNLPDQLYTHNNPNNLQFGAVNDTYRISKTEVTNAQYTDFLNAVADTDTNALYSTLMDSSTRGGITRTGSSGSYTYAVKSDSIGNGPGGTDYTYGNKPVVYVSFFDAMRFTNWLENGQPIGAQGAGTTEAGVYTIGSGLDEVRSPNATYFIPSEDEWYKAAYHKNDGITGNYDNYPTSTDLVPNNNLPSADTGNSANFMDGWNGYTTGNSSYPMTDVGAYALCDSSYGTFDQGGNVFEWNEAVISSSARGVRGGDWNNFFNNLLSSNRNNSYPTIENLIIGFRVASIPEPSSLLLSLIGLTAVGIRRRRNKA